MQRQDDGKTRPRVFLTGAFGGVGEWLVHELAVLGCDVVCFDVGSPANRAKEARLARRYRFDTVWGDLTDAAGVERAVAAARPTLVVHAAAIIPPLSIRRPELARAVNVGGTEALLHAAAQVGTVRRFVLVSSYSVHGPANPHDDPAPWTAETPPDPRDDYGRQKLEAERLVAGGPLEWTVVRLCAVFPLNAAGIDPDAIRFAFLLPYDRREQAIDVRDAALAVARAAVVPAAARRVFVVGGGEGWNDVGGALADRMMRGAGIPPFPRDAYRCPDPAATESWYYENWVDTAESQRVLGYQRASFDEFLADRRRTAGPVRYLMPLIGRLVRRSLLKRSPYHGRPQRPDPRPFAEAAREILGA